MLFKDGHVQWSRSFAKEREDPLGSCISSLHRLQVCERSLESKSNPPGGFNGVILLGLWATLASGYVFGILTP